MSTGSEAVVRAASTSVLATLAAAQFLMTLDSSVMNVSIATVAEDVGTSVTGIQTAITLYTLVMASFMITGGTVGKILGSQEGLRDRVRHLRRRVRWASRSASRRRPPTRRSTRVRRPARRHHLADDGPRRGGRPEIVTWPLLLARLGIEADEAIPDSLSSTAQVELAGGIPIIPDVALEQALTDARVAPDVADAILEENTESRIAGLRSALAVP